MTKKSKGHRIYGGDGSHWEGCHESHWDCLMAKECPEIAKEYLGGRDVHADRRKIIMEIRALLDKAYP